MEQYNNKRVNNVQFHMTQDAKNLILKNLNSLKYMGFNYLEPINIEKQIIEEHLPNTLEELESIVLNCNLCSFAKNRKNVLFGNGNKNADILFLGLSPSYLEDESGSILVGKSGEMLSKISQNILNLPIDDIYVMNILKCIPTINKDIDTEISICKSYFQKQIDIINPKIIVAFGNAYEYLIQENKTLSDIRGVFQNYNDIKVMPTFDPAFILRNPSLKKEVLEDLNKVKTLMELF